jgi:hypothetical protein
MNWKIRTVSIKKINLIENIDSFNFSENQYNNNENHLKNEAVKPGEEKIGIEENKKRYSSNLSNNEQNIIEIELKDTISNNKKNLINNENNDHLRFENKSNVKYTDLKNEKNLQQNENLIIGKNF